MTPDNIGAMIRLADNIGATEMCFLGNEADHKLGRVRRAAASSRDNIRWFFTDYLNGDTYYKIQYPEHNLVRTRAQLRLLEEQEKVAEQMTAIIKKLS